MDVLTGSESKYGYLDLSSVKLDFFFFQGEEGYWSGWIRVIWSDPDLEIKVGFRSESRYIFQEEVGFGMKI